MTSAKYFDAFSVVVTLMYFQTRSSTGDLAVCMHKGLAIPRRKSRRLCLRTDGVAFAVCGIG